MSGVRQASSLTAVRYPDHEACAPLPAPVMSLVSAQDTSLPPAFLVSQPRLPGLAAHLPVGRN